MANSSLTLTKIVGWSDLLPCVLSLYLLYTVSNGVWIASMPRVLTLFLHPSEELQLIFPQNTDNKIDSQLVLYVYEVFLFKRQLLKYVCNCLTVYRCLKKTMLPGKLFKVTPMKSTLPKFLKHANVPPLQFL